MPPRRSLASLAIVVLARWHATGPRPHPVAAPPFLKAREKARWQTQRTQARLQEGKRPISQTGLAATTRERKTRSFHSIDAEILLSEAGDGQGPRDVDRTGHPGPVAGGPRRLLRHRAPVILAFAAQSGVDVPGSGPDSASDRAGA